MFATCMHAWSISIAIIELYFSFFCFLCFKFHDSTHLIRSLIYHCCALALPHVINVDVTFPFNLVDSILSLSLCTYVYFIHRCCRNRLYNVICVQNNRKTKIYVHLLAILDALHVIETVSVNLASHVVQPNSYRFYSS